MHPAKHFIYYLLSSTYPNKMDIKKVRAVLADRDLHSGMLTQEIYTALKQNVERSIPESFTPGSKRHAESAAYMRSMRISDAFSESPSFTKASSLLMKPKVREELENLLLGGTHPKVVAAFLNKKWRARCKEEDIRTYQHYFFDLSEVSDEDVQTDIAGRMKDPLRAKRTAAAKDEQFALWLLREDIQPEMQAVKNDVLQQAWMRLKELRELPTTSDSIRMLKAITAIVLDIENSNNNSDAKMKEINDRLKQLTQKRREADFKRPEALHVVGGDSSKESFKVQNVKGTH